jgi:hypothetical protein
MSHQSKVRLGDGLVHVISPIGGGEHTLCGVACDAADSEGDESLRWSDSAARGPVSCEECTAVVMCCRGMRVSAATRGRAT